MKLKNIFSILLVAIILLSTTVLGYSGDNFSIEVGDGYEELAESGLVMFQKDTGDNIIVQEIDQKVVGGKLSNYQLNAIATEITNQYKETYDATAEQISKEETTINGRNVTKMTFRAEIGNVGVIIQELNLVVASDKIYDIIFTTVTENGFSDEEKSKILNSFEIKNVDSNSDKNSNPTNSVTSNEKTTSSLGWVILVLMLLVLSILIIIGIKRNPKSKKYIAVIILYVIQVLAVVGYEAEEGPIGGNDNIAEIIAIFIFAIVAFVLAIMQILQKPNKSKKQETVESQAKEIIENENKKDEENK